MCLTIRFIDINDRQLGSCYTVISYNQCSNMKCLCWNPSRELGFQPGLQRNNALFRLTVIVQMLKTSKIFPFRKNKGKEIHSICYEALLTKGISNHLLTKLQNLSDTS